MEHAIAPTAWPNTAAALVHHSGESAQALVSALWDRPTTLQRLPRGVLGVCLVATNN